MILRTIIGRAFANLGINQNYPDILQPFQMKLMINKSCSYYTKYYTNYAASEKEVECDDVDKDDKSDGVRRLTGQ